MGALLANLGTPTWARQPGHAGGDRLLGHGDAGEVLADQEDRGHLHQDRQRLAAGYNFSLILKWLRNLLRLIAIACRMRTQPATA